MELEFRSTGRKKELDEVFLKMIMKDVQPFPMVEDEGFRAFVRKVDPTYILPTSKALKTRVVSNLGFSAFPASWSGPAESNVYQKGDSMYLQIYLHCSVVVSSALTPDTKSCNYNKTNSSWVELNGQTSVCECCASKCKGPPYGSPSNELKALVSTGPFFIKEAQLEEQSLSNSFSTTSQLGFSAGATPIVSGTLPTSVKRGPIVASAAVSGLVVDVASSPVLEMVIDIPQQTNTAKLGVSSHGVPTAKLNQTTSEEMHQEAHDWKSSIPDGGREYLADSPGLNDWNLGGDDPLKGLLSTEEELRGDVFMNDKWLQHDDLSDKKKHKEALTSMLEKPHEKSGEIMVLEQTEKVAKFKGDELGKLEYVKKTKLAFSQASDGSSSLSYEEERSPTRGEQEVEKSKLEMEWRKVEEEGSSKKLEKALLQSLLDLVRGLNKTRTDQ
ncbi:zona pellucida protein C [Neoarius graeffei]|uniref:zona pellucida protein C n=1 Tax=Neoarius graeffei TaxID=443677 RepID=UPI00298D57EB|nr:zona pellucida protein C [Neoarius graeffei]